MTVRIGIVGTSWWSDHFILPWVMSHPQAQVVAICGRDQARTRAIAAKHAVPASYADYSAMFAQAGLDAAMIAVPDDLHHPITMQALSAGLHVYCEKPLASNASLAREMWHTARAAGVIHMIPFTYRWMPGLRFVRDLVAGGAIGRVYHCEFRYVSDYARDAKYRWRFDASRSNGVLSDLGSHLFDMARWMVGEFAQVSAHLAVHVARAGAASDQPLAPANDSMSLLAEFANGAHGVFQVSAVASIGDAGMEQHVRLFGEQGTLEIAYPYLGALGGPSIRLATDSAGKFEALELPGSHWGAAGAPDPADPFSIFKVAPVGPRLFVDAILGLHPASPDFLDGYRTQQVIDAALASHRSGCAVAITDPP